MANSSMVNADRPDGLLPMAADTQLDLFPLRILVTLENKLLLLLLLRNTCCCTKFFEIYSPYSLYIRCVTLGAKEQRLKVLAFFFLVVLFPYGGRSCTYFLLGTLFFVRI